MPLKKPAWCIIYLFLCNRLFLKQCLKTTIDIYYPQSFRGQNMELPCHLWFEFLTKFQLRYWPGYSHLKLYLGLEELLPSCFTYKVGKLVLVISYWRPQFFLIWPLQEFLKCFTTWYLALPRGSDPEEAKQKWQCLLWPSHRCYKLSFLPHSIHWKPVITSGPHSRKENWLHLLKGRVF